MKALLPLVLAGLILAGCSTTRPAAESVDIIIAETQDMDQVRELMGLGMGGTEVPEAFSEALIEFITTHVDIDSLMTEVGKFYMEEYSSEELQLLADFHSSDVGRKTRELAPKMAAISIGVFQRVMVDHREEFMQVMQNAMGNMAPPRPRTQQ